LKTHFKATERHLP